MLARTAHKPFTGKASHCRPAVPRCQQPRFIARAVAAEVETKADAKPVAPAEEDDNSVDPSAQQVTTFINTLCNETDIAEVHVQMGRFELKVRRSTSGLAATPSAAAAAPVAVAAAPAAPAPAPVEENILEESVDESLITILSPKVGVFRRGKYAGGKRVGKGNAVDVGAPVKKGQVLACVEQLGTMVNIEAPQAGELVKFFIEDGKPVEYQQPVCEISPFFGGHIIGDKKYA